MKGHREEILALLATGMRPAHVARAVGVSRAYVWQCANRIAVLDYSRDRARRRNGSKRVYTCSACGGVGHNRQRCGAKR